MADQDFWPAAVQVLSLCGDKAAHYAGQMVVFFTTNGEFANAARWKEICRLIDEVQVEAVLH